MKEHYIISVMSANRSGIVNQITGIFSKGQLELESISAAKTDVDKVVMVTLELFIIPGMVESILKRIEKIVEVYSAEAVKADQLVYQRIAFFKVAKAFLTCPKAVAIARYGASIINVSTDWVLISKAGSEADIRLLFNQLDGPHLISFMKSGVVAESTMLESDEVRVVRLAA